MRWIAPVLAALATLPLLPGSALAARTYTAQVKGIEYSATATVGKFAGTATGALPGTWRASVVHDPITAAPKAPITPTACANERFDVRGNLALDGGGTGQFTVVLTHRRTTVGARCVTYGATVAGRLTLAPTTSGGV